LTSPGTSSMQLPSSTISVEIEPRSGHALRKLATAKFTQISQELTTGSFQFPDDKPA